YPLGKWCEVETGTTTTPTDCIATSHVLRLQSTAERSERSRPSPQANKSTTQIKTLKASMRQSTQCRPHGQQGQGCGVIEGYVLGGRNSVSSSFAYDDGRVTQPIVYRTTDR